MKDAYRHIKDDCQLKQVLCQEAEEIKRCAFQSINLMTMAESALSHTYKDCIFIGCQLPMGLKKNSKDCLFLPDMGETFRYRNHLYTPEELYEGYSPAIKGSYEKCFDGRVYKHYLKKGKRSTDAKETLARTLHDHSISDCLHDFLSNYDERSLVGIMGGHHLSRRDTAYRQVATISKYLTEKGYLMISGGGPGAMEATHLGAWMAGRNELEFQDALHILATAPMYTDEGWLETAWRVHDRFPQKEFQSLGIPTWLYGHEPSTPLATHIAKYFENSIREDGILTSANGGILYTPGSAGTLQDVFQEAVQNHYLTFGYASPMFFLGTDFWTKEVPIWPLMMDLTERGVYKNLILTLTDKKEDVERVLREAKNRPLSNSPEGES